MSREAYSLSGFITSLGEIVYDGEFESNDKNADVQLLEECFDYDMLINQGGMMTFWGGWVERYYT